MRVSIPASCESSHTENLWYNETVCQWMTIYIYIYIYNVRVWIQYLKITNFLTLHWVSRCSDLLISNILMLLFQMSTFIVGTATVVIPCDFIFFTNIYIIYILYIYIYILYIYIYICVCVCVCVWCVYYSVGNNSVRTIKSFNYEHWNFLVKNSM